MRAAMVGGTAYAVGKRAQRGQDPEYDQEARIAELENQQYAAAMEDGHVFDAADTWYVDDAIPPRTAAAVALLEHRWAIGLRDAIQNAGGFHLADAWIHPADLVAIGATA